MQESQNVHNYTTVFLATSDENDVLNQLTVNYKLIFKLHKLSATKGNSKIINLR